MGSVVSHGVEENAQVKGVFVETVKFVTKQESDPKIGNAKVDLYADIVGMDDRNRTAAKVLVTQGTEAFVKHCFTGDKGETLSYAEMRARYG
jgi:hypothetical protein